MVNLSLTEQQRQYNGTKRVSSTNGVETSGHPHVKQQSRHRLYTLYKSQPQIDHRPKSKITKLMKKLLIILKKKAHHPNSKI